MVHTASDCISLEKLQYEFITSFSLGNISDCVYVVNVDAIQGTLFVYKIMDLPGKIGPHCFAHCHKQNGVIILVKGFNE